MPLSEEDRAVTAERLDSVAKVLAGATAAVAALLTTYGLTSDRVWVLLDQDRIANWVVVFGIFAVLAIGCSLVALLLPPSRYLWQAMVLGLGAISYVSALVGVLVVAGEAGDRAGAPLIESAAIRQAEGGRVLELRIVGQQLDADQSVAISVDLGDSSVYTSSVPPDFEGKVDQSVNVPLPSVTNGRTLEVIAWRSDKGEPDCTSIGGAGPSCMTIAVDNADP